MDDEYDDLDDFIDDEGEEYEREKEVPKLTKEEVEYLSIRQKLKESLRKRLKKENGTSVGNSQEKKKKKLPYDNYGSFFGPSQPVIAQRVIDETKSLLEQQHLTSRVSNSGHGSKNFPASANTQARPSIHHSAPRVVNEAKLKAQKLKDSRDYSFLLSNDADLPAPKKEQPFRNVSAPRLDARAAQVPPRSRLSGNNFSKPVSNARDERKNGSTNHQMQAKVVNHQVASGSKKPVTISKDPRKELVSKTINGSGRPMETKRLPSKMPATKAPIPQKTSASIMDRRAALVHSKRPVSGVQKAPLARSNTAVQKQHIDQRRVLKTPITSSKPQIKPPKQAPQRASMQAEHPKKRPARPFADDDDEDDPQAMIRKMFGYDPRKYAGVDEDDSDMEVNFDDIQREEEISARIAKEEDERELRLIEEEERRERLKREKRRKLSQQ